MLVNVDKTEDWKAALDAKHKRAERRRMWIVIIGVINLLLTPLWGTLVGSWFNDGSSHLSYVLGLYVAIAPSVAYLIAIAINALVYDV